MQVRSRLIDSHVPRDPQGVVLLLHGGAARRDPVVSRTQLSVLRMIPIAMRLAHADRRRLAVFRLLNSARGWDTSHTPVDDAHWALETLQGRFGGLPTCLVGHSLGGRAAILAADRPHVRSSVALNPWVHPDDGDIDMSGRPVLVVHGTADRVADPRRARAMADRLAKTADVTFVTVPGGTHAMLGHRREFEEPAARFAVQTLLG